MSRSRLLRDQTFDTALKRKFTARYLSIKKEKQEIEFFGLMEFDIQDCMKLNLAFRRSLILFSYFQSKYGTAEKG